MKILILLSLISSVQAATLSSAKVSPSHLSPHGTIVIGSIWENLGWPKNESLDLLPEPEVKPTEEKRKLSRGEKAVQEMLKKNREALKNQKPQKVETKKLSLKQQYLENLNKLKRQNKTTLKKWTSLRNETLTKWKKEQKVFLEQLDDFKEAQFNFESPSYPVSTSKLKKVVSSPIKGKFYVIPGAIDIKMKNQGKRPTCAAFAGVRALETLLMAHGKEADLSEQYFYWSSKPKCQSSPCSDRGSWVSRPFATSLKKKNPNIPTESNCPYLESDTPNNQTQVPLTRRCHLGSVKVGSYLKLETLDQIVSAIKNNKPVVAGFKLSPNFYENNGVITYANSKSSSQMDQHANGHAILLIGYIKLPPELSKRGEGKLCFLAANSWGEGWGKGGYSCLTETWVSHYRINNAFMAVSKVITN